MVTMKEILTHLEALGEDVEYPNWIEGEDDTLYVTINDFEGFDKNWNEIDRELENPKAVEDFEDWLEAEASSVKNDYGIWYYYFKDFTIVIEQASMEI